MCSVCRRSQNENPTVNRPFDAAPARAAPDSRLDATSLQLKPDIDWINDAAVLGSPLSETLQTVYRRRSGANQLFISKAGGVGNPVFDSELNYPSLRHPDSGFRLFALFRFWNRMQYFNTNREIMGDASAQASAYWFGVLYEFIRPFAIAQDRLSYQLRDIARYASPLPPLPSAKPKALAGSSSTSATTRRSSSSSPLANYSFKNAPRSSTSRSSR